MIEPIGYLLDANVVSEMMRPTPEPHVARVLDGLDTDGVGLATITVWEIFNGIGLLAHGRRRASLDERFRGLLAEYFEDRILAWNADDAAGCAHIMEAKRCLGEPLDDHLPDAILAGLARQRGLAVVTRNVAEFRNTGVDVVNPWTAHIG